jgi:two-component system, chemotaxis family, CheB/CheR fusion protein
VAGGARTATDTAVKRILGMVAERRGIDFRDYRPDTLRNRVKTRMRAAGCANLSAYHARLAREQHEIDRLVETLVVPVTEFFRDAWVFDELAERVLPVLASNDGVLRAWVVGAATGEEAYTLAIVLAEAAARQRGRAFEIVASDLDRRSLEIAREGTYPERALHSVPAELRERYFRPVETGWRVADATRGRIRFAQHDLVGPQLAPAQAIVAAFDLVLCRNVLMYFDASLRAKAVERLAAVIEPGAALVIGVAEALPDLHRRRFDRYPDVRAGSGIFRRGQA